MRRSLAPFASALRSRGFSTSPSPPSSDQIVASVVLERLPIVLPKIDPTFYAFQHFSSRWGKMSGKKTDVKKSEDVLEKIRSMPKVDGELEFKRVPWNGKADESNNRRSPYRALDKRLYLLLYGFPTGTISKTPIWHFPEKVYESERTLRQCAESALKAVIGDLSHANFVANAPMAHMSIEQNEGKTNAQSLKKFFFKSQVSGINKFQIENCEDFVWVTRDELLEYLPEQSTLLKKMIIN